MRALLPYLLVTLPWMALLCLKDWRTQRLPNCWLLPMAALALGVRSVLMGGWAGAVMGCAGGAVCALFLLVPFLRRCAGAGDVKLLFVCGCWLGLEVCADLLMWVSLIGFVLALGFLLARRQTRLRLVHWVRCLCDVRYDRVAGRAALPPLSPEAVRMPFSLAIALGFYATPLFDLLT
ncbi:MAG: prepilin peptidase [Candidatus Spyradenecus sp.]